MTAAARPSPSACGSATGWWARWPSPAVPPPSIPGPCRSSRTAPRSPWPTGPLQCPTSATEFLDAIVRVGKRPRPLERGDPDARGGRVALRRRGRVLRGDGRYGRAHLPHPRPRPRGGERRLAAPRVPRPHHLARIARRPTHAPGGRAPVAWHRDRGRPSAPGRRPGARPPRAAPGRSTPGRRLRATLNAFARYVSLALRSADVYRRVGDKEEQLAAVVHGMPNPVIVVDQDARFVMVNGSAAELFELAGAFEVGHPVAGRLGHSALEAMLRPDSDFSQQLELALGRGEPARLPCRGPPGRVVGRSPPRPGARARRRDDRGRDPPDEGRLRRRHRS